MIIALSVVSIVLALAVVLVVATHLVGIWLALRNGRRHLETLAGGLAQIRTDTAPLNGKLDSINAWLSALAPPLLEANSNLAAIVAIARRG
ncbi:MAG: hypothetical protein NVSMB18_30230 [Acetobacteraceae bacterium]